MGAGLERHDERRAASVITRRVQGADLRVRQAGARVEAFAHGASALQDHGSDPRVRMGCAYAAPGDSMARRMAAVSEASAGRGDDSRPGREGYGIKCMLTMENPQADTRGA